MFCAKIHKSYRTVVAVCDADILNKKFEDEKRQLDLRENFYKNDEFDEKAIRRLFKAQILEDATFNIVGKHSIRIAIEEGVINKEGVDTISGVPFALKLM